MTKVLLYSMPECFLGLPFGDRKVGPHTTATAAESRVPPVVFSVENLDGRGGRLTRIAETFVRGGSLLEAVGVRSPIFDESGETTTWTNPPGLLEMVQRLLGVENVSQRYLIFA